MSSFRQFVWDPTLLISQMICLQSIFYFVQTILLISFGFVGYQPFLSTIFALQAQRLMAVIQLISTIGVSFGLAKIVQRAKQCLDFACTAHVFHLILVILYNQSFPTQFTWWILQIISVTICTVLGEYLCMRFETQEIKLEGGPSRYDL
ncbi:unnamed protein product [Caenorhabditis angaria]|uniref:Protein SYS1 homolog n=1 Tax=Caenorhabditis angaria TaxID=860376 RepID=A0A9P1I1T5_9PELO|nr:unnamed protein product [Caenorhabditis angaria]